MGRRPLSPGFLREVATAYRAAYASGKPPTQAVAERWNIPHSTASKWVQKARKEGALSAASSTRPGEKEPPLLKPPPTDTAWLAPGGCEQCERANLPDGWCIDGDDEAERGVWVVYYHDMGPHVESVHATELEALRQVNDGTGKHAVFVPFGSEVREVLK